MNVRLGAFNDDIHTVFDDAVDIAAAAGLDGLAVRYVEGRIVSDLSAREVEVMARTAAEHGLQIASLGSQFGRGFYLEEPDAATRALREVERLAPLAEAADTPLIRVFAFWLSGQESLPTWRRRPDLPQVIDRIAQDLRRALAFAERMGMTLMFELEGASYVGTVGEARQLFAALDSPAAALCWDVCNGWWSGEDPSVGLSLLGDLPVVDVQTKDVPSLADDPSTPSFGRAVVGDGDVGYGWLLPDLISRGYQGWITAERVHHPLAPESDAAAQAATLADIDALRRIVRPIEAEATR